MANIKSKIKSIKKMEELRARNAAIKSRIRKAIKKAKLAAEKREDNLLELVRKAHKEINTAASKGVLHKNNAARKASRLDAFVAKHSVTQA